MQLNRHKAGRVAVSLSLLTAKLLSADIAEAQTDPVETKSIMTEPPAAPGSITVDSAVLFYQERGSRVQAIEPTMAITANLLNGDVISGSFTYDTLTGATPNGAAPWTQSQAFTATQHAPSTQIATTSASGNRTVTSVPGTGLVRSSYSTPAGKIPLDAGFYDHRFAGSLGYSWLLDPDTRLQFGGAVSFERDYRSFSGNIGVSRDLFKKNTTASLAVNFEYDQSRPYLGTPSAFQSYATLVTGRNEHKRVLSFVAGVTQTITRFWLTQINYSYGDNQGYQSDPYKILSLVNPLSGAPMDYLYENRPRHRVRQSIFWGNKIAVGPTVADLSFRYYHDNWGINAFTAEVSEQIPILRSFYVEPLFRYYHQKAASFYRGYLLYGSSLPQYASSDFRLGRFNATTIGIKAGVKVLEDTDLFNSVELYLDAEDYRQSGHHLDPTAPGSLASLNLFSGVHAYSIMTGVKFNY